MQRWIAWLLLVAALWRSDGALAQTTHYATPPGGLTIKSLVVFTDGWAFVNFEEAFAERIHCGHVVWSAATYTYVAWINMSAPTGRHVYGTAATAFMINKKLDGVSIAAMGTWCDMKALSIAQ